MIRLAFRTSVLFLVILSLAPTMLPQREVSIPFKNQDAYVIEFREPFDQIVVDIGESKFITAETIILPITEQTILVNKKNQPIDRSLVRPGMMLSIDGERTSSRLIATRIKIETDLEKWEVEEKGYFESLDGDKAWINGQAVRLSPGAIIRGVDNWKGKLFASFNEMQLGSEVRVKGVRRADGIVYASSGEAEMNEFSNGDKKMLTMVAQNTLLPASLSGGKAKVAGREVKFADDLELQKYVTKVGNRLIPRYQKDLPNDYPGKLTYRFAVIEDESFNAFALPDGAIFVHTGLLKNLKNEAQLAAVLGHEIAHVTHEHSRKRFQDPKGTWLPIAAILGGAIVGGKTGAAAGAITANAVLQSYNRGDEDQADRVGLYYMSQAGYDPRESPKVWRDVGKSSKQDATANFLYSGHSLPAKRLRNLNREIAFNYYDTHYSQTKIGNEDYMNVVGVYFGWIPKPSPKAIVVPAPMPTKPKKAEPNKPVKTRAKAPTVRKKP